MSYNAMIGGDIVRVCNPIAVGGGRGCAVRIWGGIHQRGRLKRGGSCGGGKFAGGGVGGEVENRSWVHKGKLVWGWGKGGRLAGEVSDLGDQRPVEM
jgi:hypothetical protein